MGTLQLSFSMDCLMQHWGREKELGHPISGRIIHIITKTPSAKLSTGNCY